MTIIGIDGCKGGWVVATGQPNLSDLHFAVVPDLCEIFREAREGHVQAIIDVPIGLSDREPRISDIEARKVLSRRHKSSVFPAPARSCLAAYDYGRACQLSREACGKSLSKEGYGILRKIREVDDLMDADLQGYVREGHPEVTFACLAGHGLQHSKKTQDGERERLELLELTFDVSEIRHRLGRGIVARDDIIDAAACLVTAQAWVGNRIKVFPPVPCLDHRGLRMEIVAPESGSVGRNNWHTHAICPQKSLRGDTHWPSCLGYSQWSRCKASGRWSGPRGWASGRG